MVKLSQVQKIIEFLKSNPNQKFTARAIAEAITSQYPEEYQHKRQGFKSEQEFLRQIVAEVGAAKAQLIKQNPNIIMQDKPRPRLYWYQEQNIQSNLVETKNLMAESQEELQVLEHDVYPKLMEYLNTEFNLYCLRIDEKKSKNNRGKNGNQWLHPDIVAMQALDLTWNNDIRQCVKLSSGQNVRLWSFEVKLELNSSNVRESFFQAVSNSSWANEGYLVATSITGEHTLEELRILSALHGIGVIILSADDDNIQGEILLPAQRKLEIDWQSVNRIVEQNKDFATFVEYVATYYQSGKIFKYNWNK